MADVIVSGGGIYCIKNLKSGKCYVGSAVNFKVRWKRHRTELRSGTHHSQKLQRAWEKHGESGFSFCVLEPVKDPSLLVEREQVWIDSLNAVKGGYNVCPHAGSALGMKRSEAMRQKMREIRAANPITPEQWEKMRETRRSRPDLIEQARRLGLSRKGYRHTEEAKLKISEAGRNRMSDPAAREAQRVSSTGRRHTQETIAKMKAVPKAAGWKHSPEAIEKIRQAGTGRKMSKEAIERRVLSRKKNADLKRSNETD